MLNQTRTGYPTPQTGFRVRSAMPLCVAAVSLTVPVALRAQGILTVTPRRTVSIIAGTGTLGFNGDGAAATSATLAAPSAVAYDAFGNLYLADTRNHVIRRITAAGVISTVAGSGTSGFAGDGGAATSALLDTPMGVAIDALGNLYIADSRNNRIRKVTGTTISTVAGSGALGFSGDGAAATSATLAAPSAVAVDASGNLFIADTNNQRIRKVTGTTITTVAGSGIQGFLGDGAAATSAALDTPVGLAVDTAGNLYIADRHNQRVRLVTQTTGLISTLAGSGPLSFSGAFAGDGAAATAASLARPTGVSVDTAGNVYITDADNQRVRQVSGATIATIAGSGVQDFFGDAGTAISAAFNSPRATAVDASGNVVIADKLNQRLRLAALPSLAFGNQTSNTTSAMQLVLLSNTGTASITISATAITGSFQIAPGGTCSATPITLAAGASCTEVLVFRPAAAGLQTGSVVFSGNNVINQTILLSGTGVAVVATRLIYTANPATPIDPGGNAGTVTLALQDANGNLATTDSSTNVTLTVSGPSSYSATYTAAAANGIATFALGGVALNASGIYTYAATSGTLTGATASQVVRATQTISFTQPATPAFAGTSATLQATGGGSANAVTFSLVSGNATLSGSNNSTITYNGTGTVVIAANQAGNGAYTAATQVTRTVAVTNQTVFVINSGGTVVGKYDNGNAQSGPTPGGGIGAAIGTQGDLFSINTNGTGLSKFTDSGAFTGSYTAAALTGGKALAVDGQGVVWVVNADGTIATFTNAGTPLYSTGVAAAGNISGPTGILVDTAGSLWISNSANNTATEVIGAAAPVATPVVAQVITSTPGTRP